MELLIKILADYLMIPIVLIGALVLVIFIPKGHRLKSYGRIILAGLTAYFLAKVVGYFFQPESFRPFEQAGLKPGASYMNNPGFPSDHVLLVFAISLAVWFETRRSKIFILLLVLSSLVAVGRVMALVHSPIDVLGGLLFALLGSVWYLTNEVYYGKNLKR